MIDTDRARTTAEALAALPTAQKLIYDLCDQLDDARRVIDRTRAQAAAALGLADDPDGPPLLGECIKKLVAERDDARHQRDHWHRENGQAWRGLGRWCRWADQVHGVLDTAPEVAARVEELEPLEPPCAHVDERDRARSRAVALHAAVEVFEPAADAVTRRRAEAAQMEARADGPDPWAQVAELRAAIRAALDEILPHDLGTETLEAALAATDPAGAGQ